MELRLTDEEFEKIAVTTKLTSIEKCAAIDEAASKKARNQTLKEVRDWLEACGLGIAEYTYTNGSKGSRLKDKSMGIVYISRTDDPNRFFPKDAP